MKKKTYLAKSIIQVVDHILEKFSKNGAEIVIKLQPKKEEE